MFSRNYHQHRRSAPLFADRSLCHLFGKEAAQGKESVGFIDWAKDKLSGLFGKKNAEAAAAKVQKTTDLFNLQRFNASQQLQQTLSQFDPDDHVSFAYSGEASPLLDGLQAQIEYKSEAQSSAEKEQGSQSSSRKAKLIALHRWLDKMDSNAQTFCSLDNQKRKHKGGKKQRRRRKNRRERAGSQKGESLTVDQRARIDLEKMIENIRIPSDVTIRLFDGHKVEAAYKYSVTKKKAIYTEVAHLNDVVEKDRPDAIKKAVDRLMKRVNTKEVEDILKDQIEKQVTRPDERFITQVIKPYTVVLTYRESSESFSVQDVYEDDRPDFIEKKMSQMKKRVDAVLDKKEEVEKKDEDADLIQRIRTLAASDLVLAKDMEIAISTPRLFYIKHTPSKKEVGVQLTDADIKTDNTLVQRIIEGRDELQKKI